MKNKMIY